MELRSNPVSLVIQSGCFWGCIVVLMTGWISLEWQEKCIEWVVHRPPFLPAPWLLKKWICCVTAHGHESATGRKTAEALLLCTWLRLCTRAFLPGVCTFLSFHSSLLHSRPLHRRVYIYLHSRPAVSLLTPVSAWWDKVKSVLGATFQGDECDSHRVPETLVKVYDPWDPNL